MRASLEWLRKHADLPRDAVEVAERLTMAGFVVASVEAAGEDSVLDVEVTYNRPDLLCHEGLARELAGIFGVPSRRADSEVPAGRDVPDRIPVSVEAPDLCPLYTGRVVRGARVGPSPAWLVRALEAVGQRSVNNVVDVTNHVMLETGQPLHAFDLARLDGPAIVVRRARSEPMTAIDGRALELGTEDLAICDARRPVALAGVMGGRDSEVAPGTADLLLESALFAPLSVRASSRRHQLRSESSFRFERFVDPDGVLRASDLAARMFVEVCGATGVGPVAAAGPLAGAGAVAAGAIRLRARRVAHVLGLDVPEEETGAILVSLGLRRAGDPEPGVSEWLPPSWRPDLVAEIDLIEEIGRRVGFDRVPERTTLSVRPRVTDPSLDVRRRVREQLVRAGLRECVSAPFVASGPADVALFGSGAALRVENPMRADENLLRRSLLGPLLATARRNQERGVAAVRLFECAPVYLRGNAEGATDEVVLASGLVAGGYADAKGCVETVLDALGIRDAEFVAGAPAPLRGDRSAWLVLGSERAGVVGEVSARGLRLHGLAAASAAFELRLDVLERTAAPDRTYRPISRFPAVLRDVAWVVADEVRWGTIDREVRAAGEPLVRDVEFLSEFRAPQLGAGRKSVAFRMELRAADRTLTGDEAEACVASVLARLEHATGGELRA